MERKNTYVPEHPAPPVTVAKKEVRKKSPPANDGTKGLRARSKSNIQLPQNSKRGMTQQADTAESDTKVHHHESPPPSQEPNAALRTTPESNRTDRDLEFGTANDARTSTGSSILTDDSYTILSGTGSAYPPPGQPTQALPCDSKGCRHDPNDTATQGDDDDDIPTIEQLRRRSAMTNSPTLFHDFDHPDRLSPFEGFESEDEIEKVQRQALAQMAAEESQVNLQVYSDAQYARELQAKEAQDRDAQVSHPHPHAKDMTDDLSASQDTYSIDVNQSQEVVSDVVCESQQQHERVPTLSSQLHPSASKDTVNQDANGARKAPPFFSFITPLALLRIPLPHYLDRAIHCTSITA